jgi:CHAD domain-containing protein
MVKAQRIKGIDCDGAAGPGIRKALKERFDEMYALREDALKWKDPEGVHSMRVASRRLRSALSDFMPYINKRALTSSLKQIRSIADALGEVRDQDVAISALEKLLSQTPPEFSATKRDLIDARKQVRRTARQELEKILDKGRLKDLNLDFESAIGSATGESKRSAKSSTKLGRSYINVARAIIRDRLSELEKLSNSLYRPLEGKPLHEMRIAAKRLRYALELFEGCWQQEILRFAKDAARLQSDLGRVHDCDIWIESIGKEIVESKKSQERKQSETFVWLFTHFNELRNVHFREAFARWSEWKAGGFSDKLKEAIK